ncbi:hypothetical protein AAFF_G00422030, partial [Aldrovandia affinis]
MKHFHCCYCPKLYINRSDFIKHLTKCQQDNEPCPETPPPAPIQPETTPSAPVQLQTTPSAPVQLQTPPEERLTSPGWTAVSTGNVTQ